VKGAGVGGALVWGVSEVADHSDAVRATVHDGLRAWTDALALAVTDAQQTGEVAKALDASTLARFMLSAWEGALISVRADRSARAFEAFFTVVFGVLLR
jgi:TetR/AcrR family transcriptional repressor of nem operon